MCWCFWKTFFQNLWIQRYSHQPSLTLREEWALHLTKDIVSPKLLVHYIHQKSPNLMHKSLFIAIVPTFDPFSFGCGITGINIKLTTGCHKTLSYQNVLDNGKYKQLQKFLNAPHTVSLINTKVGYLRHCNNPLPWFAFPQSNYGVECFSISAPSDVESFEGRSFILSKVLRQHPIPQFQHLIVNSLHYLQFHWWYVHLWLLTLLRFTNKIGQIVSRTIYLRNECFKPI